MLKPALFHVAIMKAKDSPHKKRLLIALAVDVSVIVLPHSRAQFAGGSGWARDLRAS